MNYTVEALRTTEDILKHKDEWLKFEEKVTNLQLTNCYKYFSSFWSNFLPFRTAGIGNIS